MGQLVDEAVNILASRGDVGGIGELLHEAWEAKRGLSSIVSNPEIDAMYEKAMSAGAIGGKLTGAGGGGFLLLFVPPDKQKTIRNSLEGLVHVPFKFEFSGSQIIFYDLEQEYQEAASGNSDDPKRKFTELEQVEFKSASEV